LQEYRYRRGKELTIMCGVLNQTLDEVATGEDVGKVCILCGHTIQSFEGVHRSHDGEIVHQTCFNDLNDEDAHFYEPVGEERI